MSRTRALHGAVLCLVLTAGCARGAHTITRRMGVAGWSQVDRGGTRERVAYGDRFTSLPLESDAVHCADLGLSGDRPVLVFVHGIGGDGTEWVDNLPRLMATRPAGAFMFRWVPYDERDALAQRFGEGISRLLSCRRAGPILVLAHSAGGVVASFGASRIRAPDDAPAGAVRLLTVASPLAGTVEREGNPDGRAEAKFMLDLGSAISGYPPAPSTVHAVHLRTRFPADHVMKPKGTLSPNDPKVGIPGARQVDLPADLGHVQALYYVTERVSDGQWTEWFQP